jgi:preprotein translocase subunit SecF
MRLFANANYDFLGARRLAAAVVGLVTVPGFVAILLWGVNYSIEFTGGTRMQIEAREAVDVGRLRQAMAEVGLTGAEIQRFGSDRELALRARTPVEGADVDDTQVTAAAVAAALTELVGEQVSCEALRQPGGSGAWCAHSTEAVGPKVGAELRRQAAVLVLLSLVAVLIYLAIRFEWRFGVAAVAATAHDVLACLAFIGLFRIEVSLFVVGALLSTVGYSLNDTIVVFDRVRENLRKLLRADFITILNRSINETLPRTVFTGLTGLGSLVALAALGGEVVRPFALVMLCGLIVGTFSSIFIAAPVLLAIERRWPGPQARGVKPKAAPAGARVK